MAKPCFAMERTSTSMAQTNLPIALSRVGNTSLLPSLLAIHANSIPVFRQIPPHCTRIYQMQKTQLSAHCPLIHIGRAKSCEGFKKSPTFFLKRGRFFRKRRTFFCICRRFFKSPSTLYCYPCHFRSATADAPLQR